MTKHLPECADKNVMTHYLDCFCDVLRLCESRVTAEAVQRVEELPWTSETWNAHAERASIIAAIKGDYPGETPVLERFILALVEAIKGDQT